MRTARLAVVLTCLLLGTGACGNSTGNGPGNNEGQKVRPHSSDSLPDTRSTLGGSD